VIELYVERAKEDRTLVKIHQPRAIINTDLQVGDVVQFRFNYNAPNEWVRGTYFISASKPSATGNSTFYAIRNWGIRDECTIGSINSAVEYRVLQPNGSWKETITD